MQKKNVEVSLSEIVPYKFNNKKHPKKQIDAIKNSIIECGYIVEVIVDENNVILAWHWRYIALQELGFEKITVQKVSWLSEVQKKKYRIIDNTTSDLGEYDLENIKIELEDIDDVELTDLVCDIVQLWSMDGMEENIKSQKTNTNAEVDIDWLDAVWKACTCPSCGHEFIVW